jgi:GWxTD domain-containing protein
MKKFIFLYIFFAMFYQWNDKTTILNAQKNNRFTINTVFNRFWQTDSTSFFEIATECYPRQVLLKRDSLGYHGNVEFRITIQNAVDGKIVQADRFYVPVYLQDSTLSTLSKSLLSKVTYVLKRGSYSVALYAFDSGNISRRDSTRFAVDILPKPGTVALSDLELCTNISESTDKKDVFYKNSYRVLPNPSLVFGSNGSPVVFTYSELYNLQNGFIYSIKLQIIDSKGLIYKQRTRLRKYSINNAVDIAMLNITSLASGRYTCQYILSDTLGHEITRSEKKIFIYNPDVQPPAATKYSAKGAELAGLSNDELVDEFRKIKYLVNDDMTRTFNKITSQDGRREFLAKFWTDVENGQHEGIDFTRTIFLDRILTANQRYHAMGKEGWLTDRGRVYLLYAEPDEVERFPSSSVNKPYEIWHYNQIESGVIFVFIDRSGLGNYTLVHSTKRGEIQDESWQQYLQ